MLFPILLPGLNDWSHYVATVPLPPQVQKCSNKSPLSLLPLLFISSLHHQINPQIDKPTAVYIYMLHFSLQNWRSVEECLFPKLQHAPWNNAYSGWKEVFVKVTGRSQLYHFIICFSPFPITFMHQYKEELKLPACFQVVRQIMMKAAMC